MALIPCPDCGYTAEADDLERQRAHMEAHHPDTIRRRLQAAGLWDYARNQPLYPRPADVLTAREHHGCPAAPEDPAYLAVARCM